MKSRKTKPPSIARAVLYMLQYYREEHLISSDLNTEFKELAAGKGRIQADFWYWGQVLYAVGADFKQSIWFSGVMIKNLFKISLRNLKRQKMHAFINIAGLAVGLTVSILMFQYIRFELSFDNFHENADRIYRINAHDLERDLRFAGTQAMLARTLKQDFPEILKAARLESWRGYFKYNNNVFYESNFFCVDPDFKDIFTYPLLEGDFSALDEPFALFITQELAEKYFQDEDPLGKTLAFNNEHEFIIRGILKEIPENSYLQFDMLASMSTLDTLWGKRWMNRWISHDFNSFVLLEENVDMAQFEEKLNAFIRPPDIGHEKERDVYYSQPLKKIHFGGGLRSEVGQTNDILYIQLLTAAAVLILLIACLNYTTLATARASKRTREIGLRKVVGAGRMSLIKQFLGESTLFALLAFLLAILSVELLLPAFNHLMNRSLELSLLSHLPFFLGISLLVGLISGVYPALYLSSFHPTQIFRKGSKNGPKSSAVLHKSLVMTQFTITIALLACILIIKSQINYLVQNSVRDFDDPVITVELNDKSLRENHEALLQAFKQSPQVLESTVSYSHPLRISWGMGMKWLGTENYQFARVGPVDFNYIDFYGIKIIKGRTLTKEMSLDKTEAVLLNESAAKASPWEDPIGKRLSFDGHEGTIIGIVEDFHFQPLYNSVEGLALRHIYQGGVAGGAGFISLKISGTNIPGTLKFLEETWASFSTYFPFRYSFLDEAVDRTYRTEIRLSRSLTSFTFIAIFLACLGLFGLTSFTAERRTKEIGVRKVLGASLHSLLFMLSKEITKWVGLASVVAFPLAYFTMQEWLQRFVYRIDIGWMTFILATAISFGIAILAISFQSIKAAVANPMDSLRYE